MALVVEYGYLERPYLADGYLAGVATYSYPSQVEMKIDTTHQVKAQTLQQVVNHLNEVRAEIDRQIGDVSDTARSQTTLTVIDDHTVKSQTKMKAAGTHRAKSQIEMKVVADTHVKHAEVKFGNVLHENCEDGGYLTLPYLSTGYLAGNICARIRAEVDRKQANAVRAQINFQLYNTFNLRVLNEFPSRGSDGTNWTANTTATGDFSVNNLNTDIVEQVWRSDTGDVSGITLSCDTEVSQGIFLDTLAVLNHNFTTSASVVLQGSNDSGFASIGFTETLDVLDEPNLYYISPTLPTTSYRYWRFLISDSTNTADYLQVGTIVFGSAVIFQGETIVDRVRRRTVHFADKVRTEAFTNVSNDRALKFAVVMQFKNLNYTQGNYSSIREVFLMARTSLKCLWIPTPDIPERFAVFGKISEIPEEEHNVKGEDEDYVDFTLEVDESL